MALRTKSVSLAVGVTNTTPANQILAANSAVTRYIRSVHVVNNTAGAIALHIGVGAAAIAAVGNSDVAFGLSIPANSNTPVAYYGGRGKRAEGTGSANSIFAFATSGSAGNLFITVTYDESDTLDA